MIQLVEVLFQGLGVSYAPGDLVETRQEQDVTVTASLAPAGLERVDGRDHRAARAIRQALSAAASAQEARFHLVVRAKD